MPFFQPTLRRATRTLLAAGVIGSFMPVAAAARQPRHDDAVVPALAESVSLRVPGSSRFAGTIRGRDTVALHLAAMGIHWETLRSTRPAFALAADEAAWMVRLSGQKTGDGVPALLAVTRNIDGDVIAFELFVHDEARLARLAPRDDGVLRTSLAAKRNLAQVHALHGSGGSTRFLAANGARVVAIIVGGAHGSGPRLVQYRFDAAGRVASLSTVALLVPIVGGSSCCSSSGSNATFAFTITPP